jgi:hypothetical protein
MNPNKISFNTSNSHPIISNSNQYFYEKKYLSIHSEDRDVTKFPNSSEFEISLPQDYLNVASATLSTWSFPANYNVFSITTFNVNMSFKLIDLYNPGEHISDPLLEGIFAALYENINTEYIITIEPGFYNPDQMAIELSNKFNEVVTNKIIDFLNIPENAIAYPIAKQQFTQYDRFKIIYNSVTQKLWFGNGADKFVLTNDSALFYKKEVVDNRCIRKRALPEFNNWGLPSYLGFSRCLTYSYSVNEILAIGQTVDNQNLMASISLNPPLPRFYYGETIVGSLDNGFWLLPSAVDSTVYFLQAPFKISFMGPAYMYMEIDGMNCIDETSPWNLSEYTAHNSQTNGIVNSSFAKIPVPTTPISQWFDNDSNPYKYWNPPAERISKLKIKIRYHNGTLVDFGQFEYSFMIELNLLKSQQERSYSIRNAFDLSQLQSS